MEHLQRRCKLCGDTVTDKNLKVINDEMERIFNVLLLKLTFDKETQYVLCRTCSSKLFAAFNFKSTCLHMDSSIKPYVDSENPKPVDLKKIYAKQKGKKQGSSMLYDREICRLCLQPVGSKQKLIQEVSPDIIQIYIPEVNFAATSKPAICTNCFESLLVHSTFIQNCLDVGEKANINECLINSCVKIEDIEIKPEETDEGKMPFEIIYSDVKKQEVEEGNATLISMNGATGTGEAKTKRDFDDHKQTKDGTEPQIHSCSQCPFRTYFRLVLTNHELRHRDPLEMQIYKCDECDYETMRKGNMTQHKLRHKDPAEVQMYWCDECDYKSIQKASLKRHQLKHRCPTEVQMFKCGECTYETRYKSCLDFHRLKHKDPSQVPMYKCDKCKFETKYKSYLAKHRSRHKDPLPTTTTAE